MAQAWSVAELLRVAVAVADNVREAPASQQKDTSGRRKANHGNLPLSDYLKPISSHNDRRAFRKADSKQIGKAFDNRNDVVPAVASIDVLINRGLAEEGETVFVLRFGCHDNLGTGGRPAHQIVALNCCTRRTAADDAATLQ